MSSIYDQAAFPVRQPFTAMRMRQPAETMSAATQVAQQAMPSTGPSLGTRTQRGITQGVTGAVVGAGGTSAALGLGSLLLRKRLPFVSKLLGGAAKDGVKIFDPRYAAKMYKALPEASRLSAGNMKLVSLGENAARHNSAGLASMMQQQAVGNQRRAKALERLIRGRQANVQKFYDEFGELPSDTITKAIGGVSGIASAGAGGALGAFNGFTSNEA